MIQVDEKIKGKSNAQGSGGDEGDESEVDPNQTVLRGFEKLVEKKGKRFPNRVRELRLERMMSKAELARQAGLSPLTISRVEDGHQCRLDTKRKILEALGLSLKDRNKVFLDEEK